MLMPLCGLSPLPGVTGHPCLFDPACARVCGFRLYAHHTAQPLSTCRYTCSRLNAYSKPCGFLIHTNLSEYCRRGIYADCRNQTDRVRVTLHQHRHIKTPAQWKAGRCFEKEQTTVAAVCHSDQEEEVCAIVKRFFSLFDGFIVYYKKYTIQ